MTQRLGLFQSTPDLNNRENRLHNHRMMQWMRFQSTPDLNNRENGIDLDLDLDMFQSTPDLNNRENCVSDAQS